MVLAHEQESKSKGSNISNTSSMVVHSESMGPGDRISALCSLPFNAMTPRLDLAHKNRLINSHRGPDENQVTQVHLDEQPLNGTISYR